MYTLLYAIYTPLFIYIGTLINIMWPSLNRIEIFNLTDAIALWSINLIRTYIRYYYKITGNPPWSLHNITNGDNQFLSTSSISSATSVVPYSDLCRLHLIRWSFWSETNEQSSFSSVFIESDGCDRNTFSIGLMVLIRVLSRYQYVKLKSQLSWPFVESWLTSNQRGQEPASNSLFRG